MQLSKSYQLIRKLAAGGMAEVFLARTDGPRGFSKTLVLKRILPHLAGDDQFVEMFLSEARLVAQINHPNVVQIFDFGEFDGAYYIAMEYIDGPNLRTLMRRAHSVGLELEPALCARIAASACEGLAYAHELVDPRTQQPLGLVHRDVSPDNILIARNGTVKVVDFGIAKAIGQQHRTKAGTIKGKLPYMPPEQMRGRPLDRRADVFALGVVLYELLTFKRPFGSGTEAQLMEAVIHKPMRPLKEHRADVPEALERIIARCLEKDREARYPSCRHLRADLERFILSAGQPVGAEELAGLVTRLLPATQQASEPVEAVSSSSKSPVPLAASRATPAPRARPRVPATPAPPPKEPLGELEARSLPPPDRPDGSILKTDRSPASPASSGDESPTRPKVVPIRLLERSAQESLLDAAWEAGLAPTARLASQRRSRGRAAGIATLLIGLVAAVGGAIVLGRVPSFLQWEDPPSVASVPDVTQPEPAQTVAPAPQPEAPVEPPPLAAEREPVAEPPKPPEASPPPTPEPPPAMEEGSEAPAQEPVKPVAIARRGGKPKGPRRSPEPRSQEAAAEEEQAMPPKAQEAAPPAPPEVHPPPTEPPRLAAAVFESSPPAQIRVNGQFVGLSPVTLRNLAPGPVHVEVYDSVKGFAKRRTFILEPGDNGVLQVEVQQGTLELRVRPKTTVILDGKRLGQTPLEPIRLYEGKHGLRLESEELGKHIITTLIIEPGESHVFEFDMEKDP